MARFIELNQVEPGIGKMSVNLEYVVMVEPSGHADGGSTVIIKDGKATRDAENGYQAYTVSYRVSESYAQIKQLLLDAPQGSK